MSWFDSSFSFAKTAFSQAQKSIDKALDISEEQGLVPELNYEQTRPPATTNVSASPQQKKSVSNSSPPHTQSLTSTGSAARSKQKPKSHSPSTTSHSKASETSKMQSPLSDPFSSTWGGGSGGGGGGDSIWSSFLSPPAAKQQQQQDRGTSSSPQTKPTTGARKSSKRTPLKNERKMIGSSSMAFESPTETSTPVAAVKSSKEAGSSSSERALAVSERKETGVDFSTQHTKAPPNNSPSPSMQLKSASQVPEIEATDSSSNMETLTISTVPLETEAATKPHTSTTQPDGSDEAMAVKATQDVALDYTTQVAADPPSSREELRGKEEEEEEGPPAIELEDQAGEGELRKSVSRSEVEVNNVAAPVATEGVGESASTGSEDVISKESEMPTRSTVTTPDNIQAVGECKTADHSQPSPNSQTSMPDASIPDPTVPLPPPHITLPPTKPESDDCVPDLTSQGASVGEPQSTAVIQDEPTPSNDDTPPLASSEQHQQLPVEGGGVEVGGEEVERVKKELLHVREVLNVREEKLVEMSRESISLMEENQTLKRELAEMREAGESDVEDMRQEFARRLTSSEKKLQAIIRERDSFKKQLQAIHNEQSQQAKSEGDEMSKLLKEKDDQINQLMEEGEKLSMQELQSNGSIKKLRLKERQNDQLLTAQRQQIEDYDSKIKSLKEQLKKREENERKYQESLSKLNAIAEQQAKDVAKLKSERDELSDKIRSLQTNLDNVYKELAEAQKAKAVTQSTAEEAALSAQQSARGELEGRLEVQKLQAQREKEPLLMEIRDLQMAMSRREQQASWKEDHLKQEVADVQQRLQEAEGRNQELTSTISQATKPLLRQIESLQAAHSTQTTNWETVEASLTQRLVEAQSQLSASSEKERAAVEKELTARSKVKSLEAHVSSLRQEKSQLLASIELERAKLETLEEGAQRDTAKLEAVRSSYQHSLEEIRREKELLERQLEYERVRVEAESRKACLESQEKERLRLQLASSLLPSSSSSPSPLSRQSSTTASTTPQSQGDLLERSLYTREEGGSVSEGGGGGGRVVGSASAIEHLQSLLKQKEGELANTQNLAGSLERSRSAMAADLASVSASNEQLTSQVAAIPPLKTKLQDVQQHYEALLQMYGEKAEEAEELKMDIQDLKSLYRQQIDSLVSGQQR